MTPAHRSGAVLNEAPDGFRLFEYCCFVKGFDVTGEESVASAATIEDSIEVVSSNFGDDTSMDTNRVRAAAYRRYEQGRDQHR
jgi:hypothetical protein